MSDERRYDEDEVRQIFEAASTEGDARHDSTPADHALTLRELQDIGREVGIEPDRISSAARAIDATRTAGPREDGPISVRQTFALPRAPSEAEWRILVSEIRETFDAPGRLGTTSGIYEWRNGNLHVYIEPTPAGYRLRMGTRNGSLLRLAVVGGAGIVWSAFMLARMSMAGNPGADLIAPVIVSVLGATLLGTSFLRLRSWARTRSEQMRRIAERARALLGA